MQVQIALSWSGDLAGPGARLLIDPATSIAALWRWIAERRLLDDGSREALLRNVERQKDAPGFIPIAGRTLRRKAQHQGSAIAAALTQEKARLDRSLLAAEASIRRRIDDLATQTAAVRAAAAMIDPAVMAAIWERDQTAADLDYLSINIKDAVAALSSTAVSTSHYNAAPKKNSKHSKTRGASSKMKAGKMCPRCGAPMIKRWNAGARSGGKILGCTRYPQCNGARMSGRMPNRP